jgi:hypothetical protein
VAEIEYPHWLMVAGAWLVMAGFIGLGLLRRPKTIFTRRGHQIPPVLERQKGKK